MDIDDLYARLARELTDKLRADGLIDGGVTLEFTSAKPNDPSDETLSGDEFIERYCTPELMTVNPWWMGQA